MVWKLSNVDVCSPCWGIGHLFEFIFFKNFFELFLLYILPLFYKGISTLHPVKNHTFGFDFVMFLFIKLCLVWNSSLYMGNHKINLRFRKILLSIDFYPSFVTVYTETVSTIYSISCWGKGNSFIHSEFMCLLYLDIAL